MHQSVPPVGNHEEAHQFQLRISLRLTPAERLRDLEAMWDFNDAAKLDYGTRMVAAIRGADGKRLLYKEQTGKSLSVS